MSEEGASAMLLSEVDLDPKLRALRANLGQQAWHMRLHEAERRIAIIKKVLARVEKGETITASVRVLAPDFLASTISRWIRRYKQDGPVGLIDRRGRTATNKSSPTVQVPKRQTRRPRSFVKWAGGKGQVLPHLLSNIPVTYRRYFEPMVGSGAMFFALAPEKATLADTNEELINCYRVLRSHVAELIAALRSHENTYEHFIRVRAQTPDDLPPVERAARTIFLNKTCFNGLYRVNRQGHFNVPYGRIAHANFVDVETLKWASERLQRDITLVSGDFTEVLSDAGDRDIVYLDPPYADTDDRKNKTFRRYQANGFDEFDQLRLAKIFRELSERGCTVMLSNADTSLVRQLYHGYTIKKLNVVRRVNAKTHGRQGWSELLITSDKVKIDQQDVRQLHLGLEIVT